VGMGLGGGRPGAPPLSGDPAEMCANLEGQHSDIVGCQINRTV